MFQYCKELMMTAELSGVAFGKSGFVGVVEVEMRLEWVWR